MKWLWPLILVACAAAAPPQGAPPGPSIRVAPPNQTAATLDEAAVKARSAAWFAALDRLDLGAALEPLGPTFVHFEDARFMDRTLLEKVLRARLDRHAPVRSRVWSDEHVFVGPGVALFIARAVETIPMEGDRPAATEDGYNTLVWALDGPRWVIAHWQWQRAGIAAEKQRWNDAFRQSIGFNKKPNQLLVDAIKGKKPGTALDVLMGQGRNALYLAAQGWKTTGVDISDEGIRQALAEAAKQKLKLETVEADIEKFDFGTAKWDLVTLIYAGDSAKLVERIKPSIKKGGLFVCEYFHADSDLAKSGAGGWHTGELAALFKDGFKIVRDEVIEDNADWAGQRKTKLVRFIAQKL